MLATVALPAKTVAAMLMAVPLAPALAVMVNCEAESMLRMRTAAGRVVPVLVTNMPTLRLPVVVEVTIALPAVVLPVTYTGREETLRPTLKPTVLAQVTVLLPPALPAALVTTLFRLRLLPLQSSVRRVFQVVPPSGET